MAKNKKNNRVQQQTDEQIIKQVFDLYEPSKFEVFVNKSILDNKVSKVYFNSLGVVAGLTFISALLNIKTAFILDLVILGLMTLPVATSIIYAKLKDRKRVKEISGITGKSIEEVKELEYKYYFSK